MKFGGWKSTLMAFVMVMASGTAWGVKVGDVFPAESLKGLAGGTFDKDALKGKVTMVNFWATWCAACKVELVEMVSAFAPLDADPAFARAFVSVDKDPKKAEAWIRGSGVKDPDKVLKSVFMDSEFKIAEAMSLESFPMTFIVGKDGKIAHIQNGFKEGKGQTEALLKVIEGVLKK